MVVHKPEPHVFETREGHEFMFNVMNASRDNFAFNDHVATLCEMFRHDVKGLESFMRHLTMLGLEIRKKDV